MVVKLAIRTWVAAAMARLRDDRSAGVAAAMDGDRRDSRRWSLERSVDSLTDRPSG
jgi:hypothetical protein